MKRRRGEPTAKRRVALWLGSFALPLLIWSAISYVPFVWHPLVLVQDAGSSGVPGPYDFVSAGQRVERTVFELRNAELQRAGKAPMRGERVNPIFLPAPHEVATAFVTAFRTPPERNGDVWLHESLAHSVRVIFLGFIYSVLWGLPLGILCGTFRPIAALTEPFVDFIRYMPAPAFGALCVAIFGLGDEPKISIIFIGTFFQLVLVVANTTRSVEKGLFEAAQTLGASRVQLVTHVVIPAALPALFRDLRILLGWAWTYLVVAELIGEKSGISAFIYQQQRYMHYDNVYAAILMIGFLGLFTDQVLSRLGNLLFPWESGNHRLFRWFARLSRASANRKLGPKATPPETQAARLNALASPSRPPAPTQGSELGITRSGLRPLPPLGEPQGALSRLR